MGFIAPAVFERDAAKDEAQEHQSDGHVEGGHYHRVGEGEDGEEAAATEDQPGFVAVPDGGDGVHCGVALGARIQGGVEDADAEVEAVKDDVSENGKGDYQRPNEG